MKEKKYFGAVQEKYPLWRATRCKTKMGGASTSAAAMADDAAGSAEEEEGSKEGQ